MISKYFSLEEMTFSQTAVRNSIDNSPRADEVWNLTRLCTELLDPLRQMTGRPISVSSGFRCKELNEKIGGASNSQHTEGKAADISISGWSVEQLYQFIKHSGLKYDQLINEFGDSGHGWVHVSYSPDKGNRQENLKAIKKDGKTIYIPD